MDWNKMPSDEIIQKTINALKERGINVIYVTKKEEALEEIKKLLPIGAEVSSGSSTTLNEIGYIDFIKENDSQYRNLNSEWLKENDQEKQARLRRISVTSDNYLASVNAITEDGILVALDRTGSRVSAFPYAAKKLILVSGVNKITPDLKSAMNRVREYVYPLEDERSQNAYGVGTKKGKWVIIENEDQPERITLILVKEILGF